MEVALPVNVAVQVAWWIWAVVAVYVILGVSFALAFVTRGVESIDHAAKGAPWTFRLMILPGAAALWPFLLQKWRQVGKRQDSENHP